MRGRASGSQMDDLLVDKSKSYRSREVAIMSLDSRTASSVAVQQHVLVGKQFWFSGAAFIWGGRMAACHGLPSCLLHGSLLLCCCQFAALPVRCLASTSLSLSPARQPVLVLQPTPVPWQSGSTALCQCPDSSRVAFKPALMLHLSPLPLPVRCPYLGGTEERLIEQQAACLRAVTDHQQRQVRAADQVIHHPDRGCRRPPHHLLQ